MRAAWKIALVAAALGVAGTARAGQGFGFQSLLGGYDDASLQAGFEVFQTNCASCHGLNLVHYRDLGQLGLNEQEVGAIIATIKRPSGAVSGGKKAMVAVKPGDAMASPYPDDAAAAAANHGAVPPDLSLFEAGRPNGARYVQSLLLGYRKAPASLSLLPNHYYNVAFPGGQIAMPPSLKPGSVTLADGKKPDQAQMAHDVAEFLAWTAHPTLTERKSVGLRAMLYLIALGIIGAVAFRRSRAP